MNDKLLIEIFKTKNLEDFTLSLSDPASKMTTGSSAAAVAAVAAAFLHRAAELSRSFSGNTRIEYISRNSEIMRKYMVHLIDEDVKCHSPLKRAVKEGDSDKLEACLHPAIAINSEIINMMGKCMDFLNELTDICREKEVAHFAIESGYYALSSMEACISNSLSTVSASNDDTFIYVTRRENEITIDQYKKVFDNIIKKVK